MILADKIIENRKKAGWSQEELAEKLGVSRQSVSKWEGAQAIPDMKKIIQMADLFGVSTDYLLRDDIEETQVTNLQGVDYDDETEAAKRVSLEEANAFLDFNEKNATSVSTGVMMCILSPVPLLALLAFFSIEMLPFSEFTATMIGLIALLIMVGAAVAIFLSMGLKGKPFEYLEEQNIDTDYGISGMVKERKAKYADIYSKLLIGGIVLCIVSSIPLFIVMLMGNATMKVHDIPVLFGVCMLLIMIGIGVKMIVLASITQGGFDRLLEEGDYTRSNKRVNKKLNPFDAIYWSLAVAIYLIWSFITMNWRMTWIVWPIAGVTYAVYREIVKIIVKPRGR